MTDERLAQIERQLADLGPLDGWRSEITTDGALKFWLPEQFRWPDGFWIDDMETSGPADHALLEFLGDAPHAIRDLVAVVQRYRVRISELEQAIADALEPGRYGFELLDAEEMAVVLIETYDPFEETTHAT